MIHRNEELDAQNMYDVLEDFPDQCQQALSLGNDIKLNKEFDSVVIAGMGGSAIPGDLLSTLFNLKIPIHIVRDYELPNFVTRNSLIFVVSYSGNTEETISAYKNAKRIGAKIVSISSGGKLAEIAKHAELTHINVPSGLQPRMAWGFLFFPILNVLKNAGLVHNMRHEINDMLEHLKKPIHKEMGNELAEKMKGKIPLIYSSQKMWCVAKKWKINFNENSKTHAFWNIFPEFNHNEINGYIKLNGDFYVIIIRDEDENIHIRKRMKIIKELIKEKGVSITEILIRGNSDITKIFSAIYIGDWTSYWLAMANKMNPTPVEIIEKLKKKLKE